MTYVADVPAGSGRCRKRSEKLHKSESNNQVLDFNREKKIK